MPSEPGETTLRRVRSSIDALESRLGAVETACMDLPQIRQDVADINLGVKAFKAVLNNVGGKLIVAVVAAIGGTYGVTRATETKQEPTTTVIQRSAFDRALDACRQLPAVDSQGECIARVIREQMPAGR